MKIFEILVAVLFAAGGLRSLWTWSRRPFEGTDVGDHLLYAVYLTGRIGLWFSFAGLFAIYALVLEGQPTHHFADYRWYFVVPVGLAALQFMAGFALGRRGSG